MSASIIHELCELFGEAIASFEFSWLLKTATGKTEDGMIDKLSGIVEAFQILLNVLDEIESASQLQKEKVKIWKSLVEDGATRSKIPSSLMTEMIDVVKQASDCGKLPKEKPSLSLIELDEARKRMSGNLHDNEDIDVTLLNALLQETRVVFKNLVDWFFWRGAKELKLDEDTPKLKRKLANDTVIGEPPNAPLRLKRKLSIPREELNPTKLFEETGDDVLERILSKRPEWRALFDEFSKKYGRDLIRVIILNCEGFDWWKKPEQGIIRPYAMGERYMSVVERELEIKKQFYAKRVLQGPVADWKYVNDTMQRVTDAGTKNKKYKAHVKDYKSFPKLFQIAENDRATWQHGKHYHHISIGQNITGTGAYKATTNMQVVGRKTFSLETKKAFVYLMYMVMEDEHCWMGATGNVFQSIIDRMYQLRTQIQSLNVRIGRGDWEPSIDEFDIPADEEELRFELGEEEMAVKTELPDVNFDKYGCESKPEHLEPVERLFNSFQTDRNKATYRKRDNLARALYERDVYCDKDLLDDDILRPMYTASNFTRVNAFTLARNIARRKGLNETIRRHYQNLSENEKKRGWELFSKNDEVWQTIVQAVAIRVVGTREGGDGIVANKAMAVFISGRSNVGKSHIIRALAWLKPATFAVTTEDNNFKFNQLEQFNFFGVMDDIRTMFVNAKDATEMIQILGGQPKEVHAKYQPHTMTYVTPFIIMSNQPGFQTMGYMCSTEHMMALNARLFGIFRPNSKPHFGSVTEYSLMWKVVMNALTYFLPVTQIQYYKDIDAELSSFLSSECLNTLSVQPSTSR